MKFTLFLVVIQSFILRGSIAFTIQSRSISSSPSTTSTGISNRRQWIAETSSITSVISSIIVTNPKVALAEIFTQVDSSVVPPCLCDPSVSTFQKNGRIIHILGTAHISSASADVAGQLVREMKPSAVFVELDAKRVARIVPKETKGINASSGNGTTTPAADDDAAAGPTVRQVSMSSSSESTGVMNSSNLLSNDQVISNTHEQAQSSPMAIQSATGMFNPFNFREKLLNQASQLVGNSIKNLYQKLESEGFSAGEEFAVAVREGLKVNSKIVLGDQDVEVTLRRLTEALAKTDFRKIAAADAEIEQKMKELLPDSGKSIDTTGSMTKDEFTYFIETVKAKENVRLLMANLEKAAPEIYNAMVRERDMYMADGLDSLNQFESIVAVMGIAHVDGVERNLKEKGWVEVKYKCNVVR
jgi:hypothetical protein